MEPADPFGGLFDDDIPASDVGDVGSDGGGGGGSSSPIGARQPPKDGDEDDDGDVDDEGGPWPGHGLPTHSRAAEPCE